MSDSEHPVTYSASSVLVERPIAPSVCDVLVEEVAALPANSPRQRLMSYSPKPGRSQTGSLREVGGVCQRVVAPSVEPVVESQVVAKCRWKGVSLDLHCLSSSSDDDSPRCQWRFVDESRPLKRCAGDVSHSPHWDSPECFPSIPPLVESRRAASKYPASRKRSSSKASSERPLAPKTSLFYIYLSSNYLIGALPPPLT